MCESNAGSLPLCTAVGRRFDLLAAVGSVTRPGAVRSWATTVETPGERGGPARAVAGRVCVLRKSAEAIRLAHRQARRDAARKGNEVEAATLRFAACEIVFTTFPESPFSATDVLEWYRLRWQVELVFQRFKSLASWGTCRSALTTAPRRGSTGNCSWREKLIHHARAISPWGYDVPGAAPGCAPDHPCGIIGSGGRAAVAEPSRVRRGRKPPCPGLRRPPHAGGPSMNCRQSSTRVSRALTTVALVLLFAIEPLVGQEDAYVAPRTSDGRPDLNGIWQALGSHHWDIEPHAARFGPVVELAALGAIPGGLGIVEGGEIPYTEEARAQQQENLQYWLERDPAVKCYMPGVPRATYMPYPFQLVQTPEYVLLAYEFASASRIVYMNRPDFVAPVDAWMGHNIGRWEGETLVIDVTAQVPDTWFDSSGNHHSNQLHVEERYTATSPNHLMYEATITDPETFTRPWTIRLPLYRRIDENMQLLEFKCVEFAEELMYGHLRKDPDVSPVFRASGYGSDRQIAPDPPMSAGDLLGDDSVPRRPPAGTLSPDVIARIAYEMARRAERTPAEKKVSSELLQAREWIQGVDQAGNVARWSSTVVLDSEGLVTVDIRTAVTPENVVARIQELEGLVVSSIPRYRAVRARIPISAVVALAELSDVEWIGPADQPVSRRQPPLVPDNPVLATPPLSTSEGDVAHRADQARLQYGVDGTGIGVGVLSDGIKTLGRVNTIATHRR